MKLCHLFPRAARLLGLCLALVTAASAAEPLELRLWPGVPPGDETFTPPATKTRPSTDDVIRLDLVREPTLHVYRPPPGRATGTAVVVCPGGGYNILAWNKEGTEIAEWLNGLGVTAVVLKYRVPRRDPKTPEIAPVRDGHRALRLARHHAAEWGIDPNRVGILGFSAGGNLALLAAVTPTPTYPAVDRVDELNHRPDFVIPIYPAYLGDEDNAGPLRPEIVVDRRTPPMFVAVTHDDKLRGYYAALLYAELKKAVVPSELHIFTHGGHGYGMRPSPNAVSQWPRLCEQWLRAMKLLPAAVN